MNRHSAQYTLRRTRNVTNDMVDHVATKDLHYSSIIGDI